MKLIPGRVLVLPVAVMAVQIGILAHGLLSKGVGSSAAVLSIGDTLPTLAGSELDGKSTTVRLGTRTDAVTVLYAFHSECAHSLDVASKWAAHFAKEQTAERRSKVGETRHIAVTREAPQVAAAYAQRFNWSAQVMSLPHAARTTQAPRDIHAFLLSRTPWVFVFDSDGVLHYHGHGNDMERLVHSIRALQRNSVAPTQLKGNPAR